MKKLIPTIIAIPIFAIIFYGLSIISMYCIKLIKITEALGTGAQLTILATTGIIFGIIYLIMQNLINIKNHITSKITTHNKGV